MIKVLVYGTLMRGMSNFHWLDGFDFETKPVRFKGYDMYNVGGFPALVHGKGCYEGELLLFSEDHYSPDDIFSKLDILEGCHNNSKENSLYIRENIVVTDYDGQDHVATVYIWNRSVDNLKLISEEFINYRNFREKGGRL